MQNVSTALKIISALLITGGFTGTWTRKIQYNSAEVWAPAVDGAGTFHCNLPSMKNARYYHTLTTRGGGAPLVCGGGDEDSQKTCEQWTGSRWQELPARLSVQREDHSAWRDPTTGTTYLVGGAYGATSIDTVSTSGSVGRPSWSLKYDIRSVSY